MDGRSPLGPRTDAAITIDVVERAYYAARPDGARVFFYSGRCPVSGAAAPLLVFTVGDVLGEDRQRQKQR